MSKGNKSTLRIDWFDGTLMEDNRSNDAATSSSFADEEPPEAPQLPLNPQYSEKKPIGFKRLLDISLLQPPLLTLEVAHRPGFWNLMDTELKGDFIVLIVKVLAQIYNSLEPREKSRIATQLKTKFEKSIFLTTLRDFLISLPRVRIVEKRMNSQLWDDVKSFYNNVVCLLKGIVDYGENSPEFLRQIHDLLEITKSSAIGVREEHTETFSNDLLNKIHLLQLKILVLTSEDGINEEIQHIQLQDTDDEPTSYKKLSVFPTRDDLLGKTEVELKPNIVNGAYPNVKHYLDLQFKLLREDCFGPLRDGICKYMANPTTRRYENIRVYPRVRISSTYVTNNKVGHLVDIAWKERVNGINIDRRNYEYNKQLMFGSLLLFTSDNFETIMCATVLESSFNVLSKGFVAVSFQNPVSQKIFSEPYIMVESEVFFEPYHRVLKVLQSFKQDDIPMKRYIVDVQTETKPPDYLSSDTTYSIIDSKSQELSFPVLDSSQWPQNKSFGLDDSQMEAYKLALTREFAVIQGPPGTGKTFIGVKIASTILRNLSLEGTPMLIICYTNQALDQFMESILGITKSIVRLGSQSKNKNLEPYSLYNLRGTVKSRYLYLYSRKKTELESIYKEMTELQTKIEVCATQILNYESIQPYLKIGDKTYELKSSNEDAVLIWLFDDFKEKCKRRGTFYDLVDNDGEDVPRVSEPTDKFQIEPCFSVESAWKELDLLMNGIGHVSSMLGNHDVGKQMTDKFEEQGDKVGKRMKVYMKYMPLGKHDDTHEENLENVSDLYSLTQDQRWSFYRSIARRIKNDLLAEMNNLLKQHDKCNEELKDMSTLLDSEVIKTVRVVGATTTTAARRHDLLRKLLSPIVIVEEAAEVLEAHIVASLTDHCQHLILIGDHKQLRPSAAHYKLAKDYNLEISLFERMIRNGVHAHVLTTQRRMRAQFVELLVPMIYEKLDSHPSVYQYPDIKGMAHNLYFCTHDVLEDTENVDNSWSPRNVMEAKWCVNLANYLHQMKYNVEDITILATYNGQVTLIKRLVSEYSDIRDVKITAVDNYQGEENRIIILSLVRSNRDGKIGFLAASNRICVALSRAKEGFYIFGNMNVLKSASNIWRSIEGKLIAQNAIGTTLKLQCGIHRGRTVEISSPKDFATSPSNLCSRTCEEIK